MGERAQREILEERELGALRMDLSLYP
jgi:hypothetical protein